MSKQVVLLLCFIGVIHSLSYAQRPTICGPNARMELLCVDACIICDIDGFQGRNSTQGQGDKPPSFCTSINHNIQWIGFLAASEILTIELSVSNCQAGNIPDGGLEAGVFEVIDCDIQNATRMSNCDSDIRNGTSQDLRMTNLVPGKYYYLIIDGNNGDICDYSVRVTEGTTKVPDVPTSGGLQGPLRVCEDTEFTYSTSYVVGAPYYDWTLNGDTLAGDDLLERDFVFDTAGVYTVCVTASNLCGVGPQECLSIQVGEFPPVNVTLDLCDNELPLFNGTLPDSSGIYTEVLTSSIGCDSTVITDLQIRPTATLQLDTTICDGWQLPFDGRTLTNGGTYTADLQTSQGCDSTVTLMLTVEDCSYVPLADPTPASCNGTLDGSLALSVTGGSPPYSATYQMQGAVTVGPISLVGDGTVELISNLAPGEYTVTFVDGFGVEIILNSTIVNPAELISTATVSPRAPGASLSCFGGSDGRIEASAAGGTSPYMFTWSTGDIGPVATGLPAGVYELYTTDQSGCVDTTSAEIIAPTAIDTLYVSLETCDNDPVDIDGQPRAQSGNYPVTYSSSQGCDSTVVFSLTVKPTASTLIDTVICDGQRVRFNGQWLTSAGDYTADLQTAGGCDSTVTFRLGIDNCAFRADVIADGVSCFGESDGSLSLWIVGPTPPYSATWTQVGGPAGGTINLIGDSTVVVIPDLPAGNFNLTFRDGLGIERTIGRAVIQPALLTAQVVVEPRAPGFQISCAGGADGALQASIAGGTGPYLSSWDDGSADLQRMGLSAGTYMLSVLDANGCATTAQTTLQEPMAIVPQVIAMETCTNVPVLIDGVLRDQTGDYPVMYASEWGCDSMVTFSLTVKPTLSTVIDTTLCEGWVYRFAGQDLTSAGTYTNELTAVNGCDSTVVLNLQYSDCSFTANVTATDVSCFGFTDGVIGIQLTGPAPPYTVFYSKQGDAGGGMRSIVGDGRLEEITGLPFGDYELTFIDGYGVEQMQMAIIAEPEPLESALSAEMNGQFAISCANGSDGVINADVSGGTPTYTYEWSTGIGGSTVQNLSAGTYQLVLKDANGCEAIESIELLAPTPLELGVEPDPLGCDEQQGGGVFVEFVGGGQGPYQLEIGGRSYQDNATYIRLDPGEHLLTLVDNQGCTEQQLFTVDALEIPKLEVTPQIFVNDGDTAQLDVIAVGQGLSYEWSGHEMLSCTDCANPIVIPTETGAYFVTVTNADGCQVTERVNLVVRLRRDIFAPNAISPNGDGRNDQFTVFVSEQGAIIEEMRIFDRWGNAIFSAVNIPAGEESVGWDGTHRGQRVNPGVFVFFASVRLPNGLVEVVKGDVMVVR